MKNKNAILSPQERVLHTFGSIPVGFTHLPHLVIWRFGGDIVRRWAELTKSKPGIWGWGVVPYEPEEPYDGAWVFSEIGFHFWNLPQNQEALWAILSRSDALYYNFGIILDSSHSETTISQFFDPKLNDREYDEQLWKQLPEFVEQLSSWVIVPLCGDPDSCLCLICQQCANVLELMKSWCDRNNIAYSSLESDKEGFIWHDSARDDAQTT
jgi:hypothetical protein